VKAKSKEKMISDGKLRIRFVPSNTESGNKNQKIKIIAIFQIINTLFLRERFIWAERMSIKKIKSHSKCLSKYIIYCSESNVLRIFA
jgi:hypothetical protein